MARVQMNGRFPSSIQDWATDMEDALDRFFVKPIQTATASTDGSFAPAVDVLENDSEYHVIVDLPGVRKDNLKLEIHEDTLTIAGSRAKIERGEGARIHRTERLSGDFKRSLTLPQLIEQDAVEADFDAGVLTIRLPKSAKNQPKQIEIRSGHRTES